MGLMSIDDVALVRAGFEAWSRGDLDAVADLLATNVKWHGGDENAPGACRNHDQALRFMRRAGGGVQIIDIVPAGDRVMVVLQPPTEHGRLPPLRANLTTVVDGRVTEMVAYESPEAALAAAGVTDPPPPSTG